MVIASQRTIYASLLQTSMLMGAPYEVPINSTLNEKFAVGADEPIPEGVYPTMRYIALGIGGTTTLTEDGSYRFSEHLPTDAALFKHIPWVLTRRDADLIPAERSRYRLRVPVMLNGAPYFAYYLRLVEAFDPPSGISVIATTKADNERVTTISSFSTVDNVTILSPVPRAKELVYGSNTNYVTGIGKIKLAITRDELAAIVEAMEIIGHVTIDPITGAKVIPSLSEIGLVTGFDKVVSMNNATYTEVMKAQVALHVQVDLPTQLEHYGVQGLNRVIEIGGAEPMFLENT